MLALPLGPFALPVGPVLVFASLAVAVFLARRLAPNAVSPAGLRPGDILQNAVLVGLLAARLAQVFTHWDAYAAAPAAALDPRDGAWHVPTGVAVAALWTLAAGWRLPQMRRALWVSAVIAGLGWAGARETLARGAQTPLPDVPLIDVATGQTQTLTQLAAGRPMVVNLWATWCGPCRAEMPALAEAQRRHPEAVFVFANQGERPERVRAYLAEAGLALEHVVLDANGALGPLVGSAGLPTSVFYDALGQRFDAHMGALTVPAIDARLGAPVP